MQAKYSTSQDTLRTVDQRETSQRARRIRRVTRVMRVDVCTALLVSAALLLPSLGSAATRFDKAAIEIRSGSRPLVLTAYPNGRGGRHILAGRYDVALSSLTGTELGSLSLTNLCVVHTVSEDWIKARLACDGAVEAALRNRKRVSYKPSNERVLPDTYAAIAYANRAVMFLLSKDVVAGRSDLLKARVIRPQASYVTDNLAAMPELHHDLRSSTRGR